MYSYRISCHATDASLRSDSLRLSESDLHFLDIAANSGQPSSQGCSAVTRHGTVLTVLQFDVTNNIIRRRTTSLFIPGTHTWGRSMTECSYLKIPVQLHVLVSAAAAVLCFPTATRSATAMVGPASDELEEIVVTAEKRES